MEQSEYSLKKKDATGHAPDVQAVDPHESILEMEHVTKDFPEFEP